MKVFVAGGTGDIGRPVVRRLVARGHEVVATTRSRAKAQLLEARGAVPVAVDALDRDAVRWAVSEARPEAVVDLAGTPRPYPVPAWLARPLFPYPALFMSRMRLIVSNQTARRQLDWRPALPTYREGLADVIAAMPGARA